jgi:hypothetical protein
MNGWRLLVATATAIGIGVSACGSSATAPTGEACLPKNIKPTDVVSTKLVHTANGDVVEKVTVEQSLIGLEAACKNGALVDGAGKEIYFYKLIGCWGNVPPNHQEILERQQAELEILKRQYSVIEMTCNPSGLPIP